MFIMISQAVKIILFWYTKMSDGNQEPQLLESKVKVCLIGLNYKFRFPLKNTQFKNYYK